MSPLVHVAQGTLQGKLCDYNGKKYYSFEGIPYAKPPIGKLRFREPQEPESWTGIRDATKPGNKCIQVNPSTMTDIIGSEDCLYLNVYTPTLPNEELKKLPVLFYVHGGKLIFGYADYYRPDYLIEQDVIFVTTNYRLHALGFLCLNMPEVTGNMALKDTIMALKWVKNNISRFNGDENNVTVFGESAGAGIVTSYLTSKMANGLYSKVIALSGCCLSDLYIIDEDPIFKAKHLASIMGEEFDDVKSLYEFLRDAPIEAIIFAASVLETSRPPSIINAVFLPVVEKRFPATEPFFDEYPIIVYSENRYTKVPLLIGLNSHEGAFFLQKDRQGNIIYENELRYFIPRFLNIEPYSPEAIEKAKNIRDFYFNGAFIDDAKKMQYINFISDAFFFRDIMTFMDCFSKYHNGLYLFRLSYLGNMNTRVMRRIGVKGATHSDLLQYYFYKKNKLLSSNDKDKQMLKILIETVCNFTKTGYPTWTNQSIEWKHYTPNERHFMDFDDEQKLLKKFGGDNYKFWCNMGKRCKL